ncbi:unnamed protein product, partial [Rotaria sp. Silwood2]
MTANIVDDSTPEDIAFDCESDDIVTYGDSINEESNKLDNDYDSTIYNV